MSVVKRANSQFWYIQFQFNNETYIQSSKTTNKKIAERMEIALKAKVHAEKYLGKKERIKFQAAFALYKQSKKGIASYRNLIAHETVSAATIESSITGTNEVRTTDAAATSGVVRTVEPLTTTLNRVAADVNPSTATEAVVSTSAESGTVVIMAPTPTPTRDPTSETPRIDVPSPPQGTVTVIIRRP